MTDSLFTLSPHAFTLAQDAPTQAPPIAGPGGDGSDGIPTQGAPGNGLGGQAPQGQAQPSPFGNIIWLFLGLFLVMIVMQVFSGRKEKKRRSEMLGGIARHDRVQTVGGIIGTVAEVKGDEIVVKVDESTNTKVRVIRSAIQQVLKKSGEAEPTESIPTPEKIAS